MVLALGLAFLALTFRGTRSDVALLFTAVRRHGIGIAIRAVLDYIGVMTSAVNSLATDWTSAAGIATTLRRAGGLALAAGDTFSTVSPDLIGRVSNVAISA